MQNKKLLIISVILFVSILVIGGFLALNKKATDKPVGIISEKVAEKEGLDIEILREGSGVEVVEGDVATINYIGFLEDGTEFGRASDYIFTMNSEDEEGSVIKAWSLGVLGMKVGEIRRITSAPQWAYGDGGVRNLVPPNSTVIFEIELLAVETASNF